MAVGQPTEAEIQGMITNWVDIIEKVRVQADGWATPAGEFDVLLQALEGDNSPDAASAVAGLRSQVSDLITQTVALSGFDPLLREYAKFISEDGTVTPAGAQDLPTIMRALYLHMVNNSLTVASREIVYGSTSKTTTLEGSIVGTGDIERLKTDENAFALEALVPERKTFTCIQDQNTGAKEEAELFSVFGEAPPLDEMGRNNADVQGQIGNGDLGTIRALHAGSGDGGSLLQNSSFSTFSATAANKFTGWVATLGGAAAAGDITQDTTNIYRGDPNSTTAASMKLAMDNASDSIIMTQSLANMNAGGKISPDRPYFLRLMWNGTIGSATGGTLKLRLGSTENTVSVAQSNWQELLITADEDTWARSFNEDGFGIDIEWDAGTGGYVLFDDVLFAPYTLIDGTYWAIRQNHATAPLPWLIDDVIHVTDSAGIPSAAEIQYWLNRAGLGMLPHTTGTPTWSEPA